MYTIFLDNLEFLFIKEFLEKYIKKYAKGSTKTFLKKIETIRNFQSKKLTKSVIESTRTISKNDKTNRNFQAGKLSESVIECIFWGHKRDFGDKFVLLVRSNIGETRNFYFGINLFESATEYFWGEPLDFVKKCCI
jgi:hypothetical protein